MFSTKTIAAILAFSAASTASALPRVAHQARTDPDCSAQPAGTGPSTSNPDTDLAFLANPVYSQAATQATTPSGFSLVYQNLQATTANSGFLGIDTVSSYDPSYCAAQCQNKWTGCVGYTIYYERDPSLNPASTCANPPSLTNIKCTYWSSCFDSSSATNTGQYRNDFHVVNAGANGYVSVSACSTGSSTTTSTTPAPATTTSKTPAKWSSVPAPSGPLTDCPQPVSYIISGKRAVYAICLDTDFQIPSPQIYYGVPDNRACSNYCDNQSGCTKAVYNLQTQTCYLKGSPSTQNSNWQKNSGFQTIVRIPDGTPITSCPNSYVIVQGGIAWTACPGTNFFNNPATDIWYNVYSEYDCAARCQATANCQKYVFNWNTWTCYNKGNPALANTQWTIQAGLGSYYH